MKLARLASIILITTPMLSDIPFAGASSEQVTQVKTRENIMTALRGEALAFVKYSLYAEKARQEGLEDIAAAFESIAQQERSEHFAELAELYGMVGSTAANLQEAIAGENEEAKSLYPAFARIARAEGALAAAERFDELAQDEQKHAAEFVSLLSKSKLRNVH